MKRAAAAPGRSPRSSTSIGEPTIWLNRALPDPTPASARLARPFAQHLVAVSKRHGADWAAVLGVLRAQGERGSAPATQRELEHARRAARPPECLARRARDLGSDRLRRPRRRARRSLPVGRDRGARDRLRGLEGAAHRSGCSPTDDVWIYGAGREDLAAGRIDVRVVVLLGYLDRAARRGHRLEPLLGPPQVRSAGSRLGSHVRARGRHRRRRRASRSPGTSSPGGSPRRPFARYCSSPPSSSRSRSSRCSDWAARRSRFAITETTSTLASRSASLQRQDGRVVCEHLLVAARPLRRMRGLLGRQRPARRRGDPASPGRLDSHVLHALRDRRGLPRPRSRRRRDRAVAGPGARRAGAARSRSSSSRAASASAAASSSATPADRLDRLARRRRARSGRASASRSSTAARRRAPARRTGRRDRAPWPADSPWPGISRSSTNAMPVWSSVLPICSGAILGNRGVDPERQQCGADRKRDHKQRYSTFPSSLSAQ